MVKSLGSIRGRKFFEKLLGGKVYATNGSVVGVIKKIVLGKKKQEAREVFIDVDGKLVKVKPTRLYIIDNKIVWKDGDKISAISRRIDGLLNEMIGIIKELRELRELRYRVDVDFVQGRISEEKYLETRQEILKKHERLLEELGRLLSAVLGGKISLSVKFSDEDYAMALREKRQRISYVLESLRAELGDEYSFEEFLNKFKD